MLKWEVVKLLKVKFEMIDDYVEMMVYGFDFILMMEFINYINCVYKLELMLIVFFDYLMIYVFGKYLLEVY